MKMLTMEGLDLTGRRVLIREDLNVPIKDGKVTSGARIDAALATIRLARDAGARVLLMSHLGRPTEGEFEAKHSLKPVADYLTEVLGQSVPLLTGWLNQPVELAAGEVALCENVRFEAGEKANDEALARQIASLCDIYVMDAFGAAHRAHASTHGVAKYAPIACAGPLLTGELEALAKALDNPARPMVAIVGGSKVSTKLTVLKALTERVDQLIVGGGIANTFIAAAGYPVGSSLFEVDLVKSASELARAAREHDSEIPIPTDVVCAKTLSGEAKAEIKPLTAVEVDDKILDIGPETAARLAASLHRAGTIIWNGPVGVFELDAFGEGTRILAGAIAASPAFSIAGGGDTLAAVEKYSVGDRVSYISTGGGAFLEFLEGKTLPAVSMLEQRAAG